VVESIGIRKTFEKIEQSRSLSIWKSKIQSSKFWIYIVEIEKSISLKPLVVVINKLNYWPITKW
jgi:hypothetical protein